MTQPVSPSNRLIVVSNRLPFVLKQDADSEHHIEPSAGGLVSALLPILRQRGGTWVGWPGGSDNSEEFQQLVAEANAENNYRVRPVSLEADEVRDFYQGFSNEIVWPLFHDLQSMCNFDPGYWETYCKVNKKYAAAITAISEPDDFIWVHDYHLMNVAQDLRASDNKSTLGFFLHIPFPSPDIFLKLPWRAQLIEAVLQFDLVGFQTLHDRNNFIQCAETLVDGFLVDGIGDLLTAKVGDRCLRIGAFPISIDFNDLMTKTRATPVRRMARKLRKLLPNRTLVLGIDRLDYTKGIPHRLKAFHRLLTQFPHLCEKISLIQVVVPSRVGITEYEELKTSIEQLVGSINGEFVRPGGWVPIWYVYGTLTRSELLAYYRAADIALITPLRDGMNLVAKEFCACSIEESCTLILSEFAGAAAQLKEGALLVNPYDVEGVAHALRQAYEMPSNERTARMHGLRKSIQKNDVFAWVDDFLQAAQDIPVPMTFRRPASQPGISPTDAHKVWIRHSESSHL